AKKCTTRSQTPHRSYRSATALQAASSRTPLVATSALGRRGACQASTVPRHTRAMIATPTASTYTAARTTLTGASHRTPTSADMARGPVACATGPRAVLCDIVLTEVRRPSTPGRVLAAQPHVDRDEDDSHHDRDDPADPVDARGVLDAQ